MFFPTFGKRLVGAWCNELGSVWALFPRRFRAWQTCALATPLAAAMSETTNEADSPHPPEHLNITPQDWIAQQPEHHAIVVFISRPSNQIVELASEPRHILPAILNLPLYRGMEEKWQQFMGCCLRRTDIDSATEFAEYVDAVQKLEDMHSARLFLSREMANFDQIIAPLFAEVCLDPADENGAASAKAAAARQDPLFTARLATLVRNARTPIKSSNNRELLAALLNERKLASEETAQMDAELLTALQKLGRHYYDE